MNPHYSPAVVIGRSNQHAWLSGHIGTDNSDTLVEGIQSQTRQAIENLDNTLKDRGFTLKDLVKVTIFLTDMSNYSLVNEIYASILGPNAKPARSIIGVAELPKGALIEIEGVAVR